MASQKTTLLASRPRDHRCLKGSQMAIRPAPHIHRPHHVARTSAVALLLAGGLVAATLPSAARASAASGTASSTGTAHPTLRDHGGELALAVPGGSGAPGYVVEVRKAPFQITTVRDGQTVAQTTAATQSSGGPADFHTAAGWATATSVQAARWNDGALDLTLATTVPGDTVAYTLTPTADRYHVTFSVQGTAPADQVGSNYLTAASGHWYGQGETTTAGGGPYTQQPWPLDSGTEQDTAMAPAEYQMTDPFWFTQRATGIYVDTDDVMDVSMNAVKAGVFGYDLTGSTSMDATVFVERTPQDVYDDYIGITGVPEKSDATPAEFAEPLWNSWAQSYTAVSEDSILAYATALHSAGVPGQAIEVDDGWMSHYGDSTFNSKFPTPKAMSDEIHAMGYKFGLWETLWINNDATNYAYAASHGYLLKSKADPTQPCNVTWWNGTAGIVDLANPAARAWYQGQLQNLQQTDGVDGFKFDTRFYDESCATYPGYTAQDYLTLGAQFTDQFDQQGAGVRIHWTGSQKYGFVTREIDKETDFNALQTGVSQDLAISTIGYPFVETDMIGGSESQPPPTKQVLVRWAQAAALMPLMYSSTSPLGVSNAAGSQTYDQQTVDLYTAAIKLHERLAPYVQKQVAQALKTDEPIMKPLFFDFPSDQAGYTISDEWLLGDSLLAAPVVTGDTSRSIHVPPGRWYDVLRHRVVTGPTELTGYSASLAQTPMFVRLGTADTASLLAAVAAR